MFIVFGTRTGMKAAKIHGQFSCPVCGGLTTYVELRLKKHFHLFYIPVFKLEDQPSGIECQGCGNQFSEDAIYARPLGDESTWDCPQCGRTWPETHVRCSICKVRPDGSPA